MKTKSIIGDEQYQKSFATFEENRLAFFEAERRLFNKQMECYAKNQALLYKAYQKSVAENPEYYAIIEKAIEMCKKERQERELPVVIKPKFFNFKLFRKYAK